MNVESRRRSFNSHGHIMVVAVMWMDTNRKNFPYCRRIERYYLVMWTEFSIFLSAVTCNKEHFVFLKCEDLKMLSVLLKKPSVLGRLVVAIWAKKTTPLQTFNRPKHMETQNSTNA